MTYRGGVSSNGTTSPAQPPAPSAVAQDGALRAQVLQACARAREASRALRPLTRGVKDQLLEAMASALEAAAHQLATANLADLDAGRQAGLSPALGR